MEAQWFTYTAAIVTVASTFIGVFITIGKLWRQVDDNSVTMATMIGKHEMLRSDLGEHKIEVARNYATNADVERAIDRLDATLRQYLTAMTQQRQG